MNKFKKPVGLFLCGGGALGSWQSGVLHSLVAGGLEFDAVAGFSIGSLNGAAYCYDKIGELRDLWSGLKPSRVLSFRPGYHKMQLELYKHHHTGFWSRLHHTFERHAARTHLFSGEPVYDFLNNWLAKSSEHFSRNINFYVISHAVETQLPYIVKFNGSSKGQNMSFVDSLVASCAIPTIFPSVEITEHGRTLNLVDGGVIGVANINLNIFEGCKTIIMISNSRDEDLNFPVSGAFGYFESRARRMLAIHTAKIYDSRVFIKSEPAVHYLKPSKELDLGILEFKGPKCAAAYDLGFTQGALWLNANQASI